MRRRETKGVRGLGLGVVLCVWGGGAACSDPAVPDGGIPVDVPAPAALNVVLDDRTNAGDASDLVVTFDARFDPSNVAEYRVFILEATAGAALTAARTDPRNVLARE